MGWVIEDLIGTKDSVNKAFTISTAPEVLSLSIFHKGVRYRRVVNTPAGSQFSIGGTDIVLGRAPDAADDLWTRYFVDA